MRSNDAERIVSLNILAAVIQSSGDENNSDRFNLKKRDLIFPTWRIIQERELIKEENNP
jgi:hypothetical protein